MSEKFLLKDELFNPPKVHKIASEIKAVYTAFNQTSFEKETLQKFPCLELKERIYHIRDMLKKYLPSEYREAVIVLLQALPNALDNMKQDGDFGDFIYAPYSEYVVAYGCHEKYLDFSLDALREITKRFSVEFAIRSFINSFPNETFKMLELCSVSDNYHERRLASECLRPMLPWGKKISLDYTEAMKPLENLFYDDTRYVTRSVANHLNDISKFNPELVIRTLKRWKSSEKQVLKEMDYITTHALRTLVKVGNKDALSLLGYIKNPPINVTNFSLRTSNVKVGETLVFSFELMALLRAALLIDYSIHFRTKNGSYTTKVYKLKKLVLNKNEKIRIEKSHVLKANMSTRKLYLGEHKIELQINGKVYISEVFNLYI